MREKAVDPRRWAPRYVRRLVKTWLGGVGLALVPVSYGVYCLCSGHARLRGLELHGSAAVALAIAYIAVGALMHVHWFWGSWPRLNLLRTILKGVALIVFVTSLGFAIYWILAPGPFTR